MSEICSENSETFDVWRTLAAIGVKGYMNRVICKSGHEILGSSPAMHTPGAAQQILSEMANRNLKKVNFWCVDKGALPPMTPLNPYLGGNK